MLKLSWLIATLPALCLVAPDAFAQSIAPAATDTIINQQGNTYQIQGGTQAGSNLFHSFQKFGLSQGEIADFWSQPGIENIFGRVVGGDPSLIDGLIQVTGANSNLYLMNPAGIVFGANARLNVGGDFVATTANQIGFAGGQWLNASGPMDYTNLLGAPISFVFTANNGVVINQGNLEVGKNKALAMLGSGAVTVGSLAAPEGVVSVAAVPGESGLVRLSQPGQLLGYEFVPQPGQVVSSHDVGALVAAPVAVGLPKELAAGSVLGSGAIAAGAAEVRGLDVELGDLVADGGIVARADRNVVVDGGITATGNVRLLGDQDGVDGGSLVVTNAEIRTGGGDFEGVGRGNVVEADGVSIVDSLIDTGDGDFKLMGVGGDSNTTHAHRGVYTRNSTIQADGSISIDGTGGTGRHPTNNASVPEDGNFGILLRESNVLSNGADTIIISGRSGDNYGVFLNESLIRTTAGNIHIVGNNNNGRAVRCVPCNIDASLSPSGFIKIEGHSHSLGNSAASVSIGGANTSILSGELGLTIEGFQPVHENSYGRGVEIGVGQISSIGNGEISIKSHGGNGYISLRNGEIVTQHGDILIENNVGRSAMILSSHLQVTGSGNINIQSSSNISEYSSTPGFLWETNGGDINIVSEKSILLDTTNLVSNGGDIKIRNNLNQSSVYSWMNLGSLNTSSLTQNAGDVYLEKISIIPRNTLSINGDIDLSSSMNGGRLNINSSGGLELLGNINTTGIVNGGDVDIFGNAVFALQDIKTTGGQSSGNVAIGDSLMSSIQNANLGSLDTSGGLNAGNIEISTRGNIITNSLIANGSENAGDISITGGFSHGRRQSSNSIDTTGGILSAAGGVNGGDIILSSNGDITTGTVTTFNPGFNGDGGSITIENIKGNINTTRGALITASGFGNGGTIELRSQSGIDSELINGVWVSRIIGGNMNVSDVNAQSISNQGGAISLTADRGINTQGNIETNDNSITFDGPTNLQTDVNFSITDNPTISGDSNITFNQTLNGNHNLTLTATTVNLNDAVGNTDPLNQLTIHRNLTNTTANPTQITTHQTIQTGDIDSQDVIHLHSLNADIHTGHLTTPKDITLNGQHIQTGNIQTNTQLTIISPQTLTTDNITAPTINEIQTQGDLTTGHITSQNTLHLTTTQGDLTTGNLTTPGQDVSLKAPKGVTTGFINTTHATTGGNVLIDGGQTVQIDSSFTDPNNINASISTHGATTSGNIEIRHGGDGVVPFQVGDASTNGASAAITRGTHPEGTIAPGNTYRYTHRQDQNQIAIISRPAPLPTPNTQPPTSQTLLNTALAELLPGNNALEQLAYLIGNVLNAETTIGRDANNGYDFAWSVPGENPGDDDTILNASAADPGFGLTPLNSIADLGIGLNSDDLVSEIDQFLEDQYEDYFGEDAADAPVTTASIRQMLTEIETQTGQRSVVVYAVNGIDALELLLVTPEAQIIHKTIAAAQRQDLDDTIAAFTTALKNPTNRQYRPPAQKLYTWLIAPLESELEGLGVDTLIFAMSSGLRTIPLAALHNPETDRYLIEDYSLGLIPSVSLTNSTYQPLHHSPIIAMGASEFGSLNDLPAVPAELQTVASHHPESQQYLNPDFTLANLAQASQNHQAQIIHLATHARFEEAPATAEERDPRTHDSYTYIQFWQDKARFRDLRELGWYNDPQIELLVLSACETALGDPYAELGFAGLAVQTGVKSALASLWQVDDLGTLGLMSAFYDHLRDPDVTIKAEALRRAQLDLLHGQVSLQGDRIGEVLLPPELVNSQRTLTHPHYWSGFTLVGSPW